MYAHNSTMKQARAFTFSNLKRAEFEMLLDRYRLSKYLRYRYIGKSDISVSVSDASLLWNTVRRYAMRRRKRRRVDAAGRPARATSSDKRDYSRVKCIYNVNISHVLVHEFMSIYCALAGWSGNRERRDERTKRKGERQSSVAQQNPYLLQARRKKLRSKKSSGGLAV
ncbi:hypothetical protein EVAR_50995_1 [Eumeta japonica]|uniref:Uncharacterized protein n=1 Tax=Eumeta variegata TaxID=151549 RepID=A0A4C1ZV00_EUMVA|nr:hypothetical protein EVAR_50995_1 [Eumeta japonica]